MKWLNYLFFIPILNVLGKNPFDPIHQIYINMDLVKNINQTQSLIQSYIKKDKSFFDLSKEQILKASNNMESLKKVPSAYWIDKKDKIKKVELLLNDMIQSNQYDTIVLIVYDLPNRDCAALASNGEICCNQNTECLTTCTQTCQLQSVECNDGLTEYKNDYIDELYDLLNDSKYEYIQKILIIEPDSLPNIPTNRGFYGCSSITTEHYLKGIKYTLEQLSKLPNNYLYLDIGHEGWLGWCNNLYQNDYNFIQYVLVFLKEQIPHIRGFATNVANYQNLGIACDYPFFEMNEITDFCSYYNQYLVGYCKQNTEETCCYDPCGFLEMYNPANNELNYVQLFRHAIEYSIYQDIIPKFKTESGLPQFIIDTSRNGQKNSYSIIDDKSDCATWCNIRGGHIGIFPTIDTDLPYIDAYFWLKTPGESDGCINPENQGTCIAGNYQCSRYDANCGTHYDNIGYLENEPCPPEAGEWFDYQFIRLNL